MLHINKTIENNEAVFALKGQIDTNTAPELDRELQGVFNGLEKLTLDMKQLDYVSSAGLRVLLNAQKIMSKQGEMKLTGVNSIIMEVFDVTGLSDIFSIEEAN